MAVSGHAVSVSAAGRAGHLHHHPHRELEHHRVLLWSHCKCLSLNSSPSPSHTNTIKHTHRHKYFIVILMDVWIKITLDKNKNVCKSLYPAGCWKHTFTHFFGDLLKFNLLPHSLPFHPNVNKHPSKCYNVSTTA